MVNLNFIIFVIMVDLIVQIGVFMFKRIFLDCAYIYVQFFFMKIYTVMAVQENFPSTHHEKTLDAIKAKRAVKRMTLNPAKPTLV